MARTYSTTWRVDPHPCITSKLPLWGVEVPYISQAAHAVQLPSTFSITSHFVTGLRQTVFSHRKRNLTPYLQRLVSIATAIADTCFDVFRNRCKNLRWKFDRKGLHLKRLGNENGNRFSNNLAWGTCYGWKLLLLHTERLGDVGLAHKLGKAAERKYVNFTAQHNLVTKPHHSWHSNLNGWVFSCRTCHMRV